MAADQRDLAVVLPTARDRAYLGEAAEGYELHWLDDGAFSYPRPEPGFDILEYTRHCSDYIAERGVDGVLYSHDIANLVAGVLCEEHDLPGPSFESMFLTDHKYYSRGHQPNPPWYDAIDLTTGDWDELDPRFPCYAKPPFLTMTLLQHGIETSAELEAALETMREELPVWNDMFRSFFERFVDTDAYPLAVEDIVMVEEWLTDWTQHCVEGWSDSSGQAHVWAISDHHYYPGDDLAIDSYVTPTALGEGVRRELVDIAEETVDRHGIEGGLWNVEIFRLEERAVVTEVNGRAATVWEPLYRGTFGASVYRAMSHLAAGAPDRVHEEAPAAASPAEAGTVGGQFHAVTFGEGPAEEFVDFDYARSVEDTDIELFVEPGDNVDQSRTSGEWLARFHLFGADYETIAARADEIRSRLLLRPEASPTPERMRA